MINSRIAQFLFLSFVFTFSGCDTKDDFEGTFKDYFIKYYGEDGKQEGVDLIVNDDGTLLLLGNTISPAGVSQVFLVKTDSEGNIIWQKIIGGIDETAVDIEPTLAGDGFVILSNVLKGKNETTGLNLYDTKLSIVSADGGVGVQTTTSGFWADQVGYSVTPISNRYTQGGYMITGNTSDTKSQPTLPPPDLSDIIVMFYNADLSQLWWKDSVSNQHVGAGVKVFESDTYVPLKDGDRPFYLFGYSDVLTGTVESSIEDAEYENNFWCVSLDENGGKSADDFSGDPAKEEVMSETIEAIGSGFISVGTQTNSSGQNSLILATAEVDKDGLGFTSQTVSVKESRNLKAVSITPSAVGGRYLILSNETSATGTTNLWLSKVDIEGNVVWSASFGSVTKNDFAGTVRELSDGKILILGTIELESQNSKMALIKLNANGELLN